MVIFSIKGGKTPLSYVNQYLMREFSLLLVSVWLTLLPAIQNPTAAAFYVSLFVVDTFIAVIIKMHRFLNECQCL